MEWNRVIFSALTCQALELKGHVSSFMKRIVQYRGEGSD